MHDNDIIYDVIASHIEEVMTKKRIPLVPRGHRRFVIHQITKVGERSLRMKLVLFVTSFI